MSQVDRFNLEKAITYAVEAIKAAMLLNGGAAIALMTLMGAVKKDGGLQINVSGARVALAIFRGWDVLCRDGVRSGLLRPSGLLRARQEPDAEALGPC